MIHVGQREVIKVITKFTVYMYVEQQKREENQREKTVRLDKVK